MTGMRTRWKWQWKVNWLGALMIWFMTYVAFIVIASTTHRGDWWWLDTVDASVLAAPIVLYGAFYGLRVLHRHPPIRRVAEFVPDLREEYRQ